MKRLTVTLALAALALVVAACGTASAEQPAASPAADVDLVIVAKDLKFEQAEYAAPAAKPFKLQFDNREAAPHNVAIYTDSSAKTSVYQGEIFSSGSRVYEVPALAAGSYFFRCDVHPDMTGTIVAK